MVEYRKARPEEADDLLDFINYVFSQAHRPHDFKTLSPGMYNSGYPFWQYHYVAVEDGRIRATLSVTERKIHRGGMTLRCGHVGQVSVHPYHRSKGYMRTLMHMAIDDMKAADYDLSDLNGLRQRYGYYGYMSGDYCYEFTVSSVNLRHVLGGKAPAVLLSGEKAPYDVLLEGRKIGTVSGGSVSLEDYRWTADAIAAYQAKSGVSEVYLRVGLHEEEKACALTDICERVLMAETMKVLVFNFRRWLEAGLRVRAAAGLCEDGEVTLSVGGERFGLRVCAGEVSVFDCESASLTIDPQDLQRTAMSPVVAQFDKRFPRGWFPLGM